MLILFLLLARDKKSDSNRDSSRPLAPRIISMKMGLTLLKRIYIESPGVLLWSFWCGFAA